MEKKIQQVEIGLASPEQIKQWAERRLPNGEIVGEVKSWETVNYKTLKAEPDGLFCQRIFGPVVDDTCACNKKKLKRSTSEKNTTGSPSVCPICGVERTTSRVRRYRLGYIKLHQPVVHPLFALNRPSPLPSCLNWSTKRFQAVLYGIEFCKLPVDFPIFVSEIAIYWFFFKTIKQSIKKNKNDKKNKIFKKPKLFRSCTKNWTKTTKLETEFLLYGITYDATWREVENVQQFLLYNWEQSKTDDKPISYYTYQNFLNKNKEKELPRHEHFYPLQTGGLVIQRILSLFNVYSLSRQEKVHASRLSKRIQYFAAGLRINKHLLDSEEYYKKLKVLNRLKQNDKKFWKRRHYLYNFYASKTNPAWMVLSYLPVLPPDLRPIMSIDGQLMVSDINSLYRKVLTRNKRVTSITKFQIFDTALSGSWASWCYNLRQVQEAVNSLIKTGSTISGKTTKSLLDSLKGKKGRFRQHLLGKRVDYSGRSVIVVGPKLKIYECGLPKQMALQLFQPFIIQKLRSKRIALTNAIAKNIISEKKPVLWSLLEQIMKNHPVLLNRAPTLHRLGIQAFLPRLIEGKAILLHPLVCPAFNADFDGDQMAVHIPLGAHARSEAFHLMWSRNHLLAPASGEPLLLPTQDMVLGCYYLTIFKNFKLKQYTLDPAKKEKSFSFRYYFSTLSEVQQAYNQGILEIHFPIWIRWFGVLQNFLSQEESKGVDQPIEFRVDVFGKLEFIFSDRELQKQKESSDSFYVSNSIKNSLYIRTTPGRVFFHSTLPH